MIGFFGDNQFMASSIELKGDILNLNAASKERQYAKEILLPCPVKQESLQKSFHNGILEITIEKA